MGETQESHSKFGDPLGPYMSQELLFHSVTCGQSSILLHFLFTQEIFQITENSLKQLKPLVMAKKQEPDYNLEWSLGGFILNFHVLFYSFLLPIN